MVAELESRPSIVKVWAKNFRSIESTELELEPLTVLVGPNASGKSNLLDLLGFLGDTARDGLEAAIKVRGGIDSIKRRSPNEAVSDLEVILRLEVPWASHPRAVDYGFTLASQGDGGYKVKREFARIISLDTQHQLAEIEISDGFVIRPSLDALDPRDTSEDGSVSQLRHRATRVLREGFGNRDLLLISERVLRFDLLLVMARGSAGRIDGPPNLHLNLELNRLREALSEIRLYHILADSLRKPQKAAHGHPLDVSGENLASTIKDMLQKNHRFLSDLKSSLNYAVPSVCDIRVSTAGSFNVVELKHTGDSPTQEDLWFDLSYESDGTVRLLAILTALFQEPSLSLVGFEEPELAIHPGAMAVLIDTIQEAASRGQILVTTHSPDLIDRIPLESIRAVSSEDGSTKVGRIADNQLRSVREGLFLPGEIHSMEGLQLARHEG